MNRRILKLQTVAALLAGVVAMPGFADRAAADAMDDIKARGKIIVAIDPTFAPFEFTDASGKIVGYDPEVIEAIAKDWGVEVEYQVMAFSGIIPGIIAGSFDMSASALNVTAERAQKIDYTIPLSSTVNSVLKLKDNANVKSSKVEDLAGLKCAVKQTTQPEQMMQAFNEELKGKGLNPVELLSFDTVEQTIAAMVDKRIDCVVDDKIVLAEVMKSRADVPMEIVGEIGGKALVAWGVSKNNPKLTAALTDTIKKLKASGKLAELQQKYFGFTMDDLPEENFIPAQ